MQRPCAPTPFSPGQASQTLNGSGGSGARSQVRIEGGPVVGKPVVGKKGKEAVGFKEQKKPLVGKRLQRLQ